MEKPTVGRKVWLWNLPGATPKDAAQPFDATVIFVHGESLVDLYYTNHFGTAGSLTSVLLKAPLVPLPGVDAGSHGVLDRHDVQQAPYATWMPFQMKAAAARDQHPAIAASKSA